MKPCDHLPQYLDGRLERAGREYFETHLAICPDCRKLADIWMCSKNVLRNEATARQRYLVPTDDEANRLVQRAQLDASSRGFFSVRVLVPLTACVSFALAFFVASYVDVAAAPAAPAPVAPAPETVTAVLPSAADLAAPILSTAALEYETKEYGQTTGRLGKDRFGLAAMSKLHVVSTTEMTTVLRLDHGVAAFQVSKRKGGRKFVVQAGDFRVEVVGTRFTVDHSDDGVRVSVTEGIVAVSDKAGRKWRLTAGEALAAQSDGTAECTVADVEEIEETARLLGEIETAAPLPAVMTPVVKPESATNATGRAGQPHRATAAGSAMRRADLNSRKTTLQDPQLTDPKTSGDENATAAVAEAQPKNAATEQRGTVAETSDEAGPRGIELWRRWVLDGRFDAAEAALADHLVEHPMDTEAYSLLADCRRKAGRYADAVETYKKLTAIAGEYQANRARFKAGVLLQENLHNHLAAAAIFDEYLATGKGTPLLRAMAAVRLAGSLIELGETERAKQLLSKIVEDYSGSSVAIQAREILNKIN